MMCIPCRRGGINLSTILSTFLASLFLSLILSWIWATQPTLLKEGWQVHFHLCCSPFHLSLRYLSYYILVVLTSPSLYDSNSNSTYSMNSFFVLDLQIRYLKWFIDLNETLRLFLEYITLWRASIIQALKPNTLSSNPDSVTIFQIKSQVVSL